GEEEDERDLPDEQTEEEQVVRHQGLDEGGRAGDGVGHDGGDGQPDAHPAVHGAKEGRDPLGRRGAGRPEGWGRSAVQRLHGCPPCDPRRGPRSEPWQETTVRDVARQARYGRSTRGAWRPTGAEERSTPVVAKAENLPRATCP